MGVVGPQHLLHEAADRVEQHGPGDDHAVAPPAMKDSRQDEKHECQTDGIVDLGGMHPSRALGSRDGAQVGHGDRAVLLLRESGQVQGCGDVIGPLLFGSAR